MKYAIRTLLLAAAISIPAAAALADNYGADSRTESRINSGAHSGRVGATSGTTATGTATGTTTGTSAQTGTMATDNAVSMQNLSGAQIRQLQQSLNAEGLYSGQIDGVWGPGTAAAIQRFEQQNGINTATSGSLNTTTLSRLGVDTRINGTGTR